MLFAFIYSTANTVYSHVHFTVGKNNIFLHDAVRRLSSTHTHSTRVLASHAPCACGKCGDRKHYSNRNTKSIQLFSSAYDSLILYARSARSELFVAEHGNAEENALTLQHAPVSFLRTHATDSTALTFADKYANRKHSLFNIGPSGARCFRIGSTLCLRLPFKESLRHC